MSKTKTVLAGLASLTLLDIAAASAQPANTYDWSGFYVGGHAGVRWANVSTSQPSVFVGGTVPDIPSLGTRDDALSPIAGFQAGYNYLITPSLLAGLEVDWSGGSTRSTSSTNLLMSSGDGFSFVNYAERSEVTLGWQATIRGRLGVVAGPWLVYGTTGVAFTRAEWNQTSMLDYSIGGSYPAVWDSSKTLTGWVVGFGAEYMLTSNWTARFETLYESFGDFTVLSGTDGDPGSVDVKDVVKVRVGINYKFNP